MSIQEATTKVLDAAERLNPELNSFLSIEREHASSRAVELDANAADLPLKGVAIAIKDNICTRGMRTSCGSQILHNYKAQYDATAIDRLNAAGAIVVGKTNMDEFAMGSSNESSAFGPAKNPWDTSRSGWKFGWLGGRCCIRCSSSSSRIRNRWIGSPAGLVVRHRRP